MSKFAASRGHPVGPAAAQQRRVHRDHRQAGRSPLLCTFSSPRGNDKFVAVISRNNTILLVDDDGYTVGTILAPNRMEWCYMHLPQNTRVASCTELTKQP